VGTFRKFQTTLKHPELKYAQVGAAEGSGTSRLVHKITAILLTKPKN
jgi:hypothetical protein